MLLRESASCMDLRVYDSRWSSQPDISKYVCTYSTKSERIDAVKPYHVSIGTNKTNCSILIYIHENLFDNLQ